MIPISWGICDSYKLGIRVSNLTLGRPLARGATILGTQAGGI